MVYIYLRYIDIHIHTEYVTKDACKIYKEFLQIEVTDNPIKSKAKDLQKPHKRYTNV